MDMLEHTIRLVGGAEDEFAVAALDDDGAGVHLAFSYRGRRIDIEASDYFEALCQVRLELEREGLIPYCYGASLNVYPSGMCRDMGAGRKAYKMALGYHARMRDLVYIFASGPEVVPAYVLHQRQFFEEWLRTPRSQLADSLDVPPPAPAR
jgi:hypothetical protein